MQVFDHAETVFDICFQFNIARLVDVGIGIVYIGTETSGTDTPNRKCPDAVSPTDVELFAVGGDCGIAVAVDETAHQPHGKPLIPVYFMSHSYFAGKFDKLGIRITQDRFPFRKALPRQGVYSRKNIPCGGDTAFPPQLVFPLFNHCIVVGVGIAHSRNELILQTKV